MNKSPDSVEFLFCSEDFEDQSFKYGYGFKGSLDVSVKTPLVLILIVTFYRLRIP